MPDRTMAYFMVTDEGWMTTVWEHDGLDVAEYGERWCECCGKPIDSGWVDPHDAPGGMLCDECGDNLHEQWKAVPIPRDVSDELGVLNYDQLAEATIMLAAHGITL